MEKTARQSDQPIGDTSGSGKIRPRAHWAPTQGRGRSGQGMGLLMASPRRVQTSRLQSPSVKRAVRGKWVPETRSSQSMLLAPTRAHLAQPQRGDSEAGPAL